MSDLLKHVTKKEPINPKALGQKFDSDKPLMGLTFNDFAKSLESVSAVSTYGVEKYGYPSGWRDVPNAKQRYTDALFRHLAKASYEEVDEESGLMHLSHAAWNLLAILHFTIKEK